MKKTLIFLFLLFFIACPVFAELYVFTPKDEAIVFDEILTLRGRGDNLKFLKINNVSVPFESDGSFSCGLVLGYGKNNVEIRAMDQAKNRFVKNLHLVLLKDFDDLTMHWARSQILYLATYGFIDAYPDGNFHPGIPISRGDFATWLAKVKRLELDDKLEQDVFFDVPKELWSAPYIKAVVDAGYMGGYTKDIFGLQDPISRREAADIAVKSEGLHMVSKITPLFEDVPKEEEGAKPIYTARKSGLVKGISDEIPIYDPDRAITRAEAATLFSRFERSVRSIRYLFEFDKGFGKYNMTKVNIAPKVYYFTITPEKVLTNQKSILHLETEIGPRVGFYPMSKVWADLSEIGGPTNALMYDDGSQGDEIAEDLIYSLNVVVMPEVGGKKTVYITAADELGWENNAEASILILE